MEKTDVEKEIDVNITNIQVIAKSDGKNTLGYADLTISNSFVIRNIRIVNGKKGMFIGMPSHKTKSGKYIDLFFPINQNARDMLTQKIIDKFRETYPTIISGLKVYSQSDYSKL